MNAPAPNHRRRDWLVFLGLLAVVLFLRWPTFGFNVWNVDEAIHAGVARTLLDGGVMYRDAIDQRTPLTYYVVAAIFAVAGENNLWAVRAFLAVLIAGTAFATFLIARSWRGPVAGGWAAAVFVALSTTLLYPGDANAANTEWFVGFFTAWGAWLFWRGGVPSFGRAAAVGVIYSCAFLSKQPALLDLGAPFGLLLWLGVTGREPAKRITSALLGLCLAYTAVVAAVIGWFALRGAFRDFYFYAWSYNLVYYGPEVSLAERVKAAAALPGIVGATYPLVLVALLGTVAAGLVRLVQLRPTDAERAARPVQLFLGAWLVFALAGAASAGRVYGHYYIQTFVPLALVAGLGLAALTDATCHARRRAWQVLGALALLATAATLVWHPLAHGRQSELNQDPALPIAAAVRAHTLPGEKIFVWGWNPDIYVYADRAPASRFLYCSFLTGLVPWTNLEPGLDTSYAIVPGAMETLLRELEERRPAMIVDCSVGPHRLFQKYPLEKFPRLRDLIARHYVEFNKQPFLHRGFRVFLLKDRSRLKPLPAFPGGAARLEKPALGGPVSVEPIPTSFEMTGRDPAGRLQRLELLANGQTVESASFAPSSSVSLTLNVPFQQLGMGRHRLVVRAHGADGSVAESDPLEVECGASSLSAEQLRTFALPHLAATLAPVYGRAVWGALAREEAGRQVYFAHAPSVLAYAVSARAERLRGFFALRPEAYAASNTAPTDGAEFIVDWVEPTGVRKNLFRRLLNPREVPADRGEQPFEVRLPGRAGRLELIVSPGPTGNAACDWTYWSELLLLDSR